MTFVINLKKSPVLPARDLRTFIQITSSWNSKTPLTYKEKNKMLMKKGGFVRLSPGKGMIIDSSIPLALWRVPWLGDESLRNMCRAVSLIRHDWGGRHSSHRRRGGSHFPLCPDRWLQRFWAVAHSLRSPVQRKHESPLKSLNGFTSRLEPFLFIIKRNCQGIEFNETKNVK